MTAYYTLLTSLPRHDRQFKVKETPISRLQLEKRLKLLSESDRQTAKKLVDLVWTSGLTGQAPFTSILQEARTLLALKNPFIEELIHWYLDLRSLLTAQRWRNAQQTAPVHPEALWYSPRLTGYIFRHWNQTDFGLKNSYPWYPGFASHLAAEETAAAENIILNLLWRHLNLIENRHYFDFEAVLIYLLRWNIVNYWSTFSEADALSRVNELANQIIKNNPLNKNLYKAANL